MTKANDQSAHSGRAWKLEFRHVFERNGLNGAYEIGNDILDIDLFFTL